MDKTGPVQFIVFGSLLLLLLLLLLFGVMVSAAAISEGVFPLGCDLILLSVSVMAFCNAYLYPHFKENDKRSKRIRERGMFISYFFILGFMSLLMLGF
ncbi:hypothetical protein [Mesobacillus foraminis]|uniref:Uncharacterized protein n=1 Tax=Mesobacillus foraminis TaxID=279826 RepID=A0A4R2BGD3_9BACI|nr:hypothetical protein [Mesobacillus foraminis]TCN26097.1 hypothetical protein EV146_104204 [Mesobacillus foraminis]